MGREDWDAADVAAVVVGVVVEDADAAQAQDAALTCRVHLLYLYAIRLT